MNNAIKNDPRYTKQDYSSLNATDHALTTGDKIRKELDSRGEYNAEVYNWHLSKLPEDKVVSMDNVERLVMQLYNASQILYKKLDTTNEQKVREQLIEKIPEFESFMRTHPRLFIMMSANNVSAKKRTHVLNLIALKRGHQDRNVSLEKQQQEASAYMHAHFVREALPGEEEEAIANGTGLRGTICDIRN